jgi:hypothetical protein
MYESTLAQSNRSALSRKEVRKLLDKWVEEEALALLTEWMLAHGAELIAIAGKPEPAKEVITLAKSQEKPPPLKYEFWRSAQRHKRRRA